LGHRQDVDENAFCKNRVAETRGLATECLAIPSRLIATCFALASFLAALSVGLAAGNDPATILTRAILVLVGCYLVALPIGSLAQWAMYHHIEHFKQTHPIPETIDDLEEPAGSRRREPIGTK
jgi:hypothetical protein